MKPPAKDLERRRPVWDALSMMFLDTTLDADDHLWIADVLLASRYSPEELERILWEEVCPVVHMNLFSVAGAWEGFDVDWMEQKILSRPAGWLRRWWAYRNGGALVRNDWAKIRQVAASARFKQGA